VLTVNQKELVNYVYRKVEVGETGRKMNRNRASAVFSILEEMGYIEMVEDYIPPQRRDNGKGPIKKKGRSRKYKLTPKHPDYHRFLEVYGVGVGWLKGGSSKEGLSLRQNKQVDRVEGVMIRHHRCIGGSQALYNL